MKDQLNPQLAMNKPKWISDIYLHRFNLGEEPPSIAGVKVSFACTRVPVTPRISLCFLERRRAMHSAMISQAVTQTTHMTFDEASKVQVLSMCMIWVWQTPRNKIWESADPVTETVTCIKPPQSQT